MDVPGIVRERLDDERRMTSVNVGGDDRVYVTPPRTLVYHAAGLFSRESIDEYPHDARRFDVSADRREATFAFEYDDGVEAFSVPAERIETVLPPVLAGVLRSNGLIDADESVEESYRFGDRTLVVTDSRLLTSVGEAVWDRDNESYGYDDITDLGFEGDHLVVEVDGESRRIELADDSGREAYETVETALCAYHGVGSIEQLPRTADGREGTDETAAWGPLRTPDRTESIDDAESESKAESEPEPETESDVASSPPPSSPVPGGPLADPIPEASETDDAAPDEPLAANEHTDPSQSGDAVVTSTNTNTNTNTSTDTGADTDTDTDASDADGPTTAADPDDTRDLAGELDALRETVERHTALLERNQELLERLVETTETRRVSDDQ